MAEVPIEFVLRAMGNNYPENTLWDKLDRDAVLRAADEIAKLRAELKALQDSPPQAAGGDPVAWRDEVGNLYPSKELVDACLPRGHTVHALYDHPPAVRQEWVIPSKQECYDIWMKTDRDHSMFSEHLWRFARQLLADMKDKANDPS